MMSSSSFYLVCSAPRSRIVVSHTSRAEAFCTRSNVSGVRAKGRAK
jgi:hypothetical protein